MIDLPSEYGRPSDLPTPPGNDQPIYPLHLAYPGGACREAPDDAPAAGDSKSMASPASGPVSEPFADHAPEADHPIIKDLAVPKAVGEVAARSEPDTHPALERPDGPSPGEPAQPDPDDRPADEPPLEEWAEQLADGERNDVDEPPVGQWAKEVAAGGCNGGDEPPTRRPAEAGMTPPDGPSECWEKLLSEPNKTGSDARSVISRDEDPERISYGDAQLLQTDIHRQLAPYITHTNDGAPSRPIIINELYVATPPQDIADRFDAGLQQIAEGLADGTLSGREVSAAVAVLQALIYTWPEINGCNVGLIGGPLQEKAAVVLDMAMAVGIFEGNLPLDYQGRLRDQEMTLALRVAEAVEYMEMVFGTIPERTDLFGNLDDTLRIFEGVTQRLEMHRPLPGHVTPRHQFPRFT